MKFFRAILFSLPCFLPFLVFGSPSPSPAEQQCNNRWLHIDVNAETAGFAAKRLCKPASWAIDQMDHCGFAIEAKLTVEVVEDLRHPCGMPVVGKFDSVGFRVQVASPRQCRQLAAEEIAIAEVDSNALYESIVVHSAAGRRDLLSTTGTQDRGFAASPASVACALKRLSSARTPNRTLMFYTLMIHTSIPLCSVGNR